MPSSPFHAGELAVQQRAGEAAIAERNGSVIAPTILGGARPFIEKQFMVVLASVDPQGGVWSSVLYGRPGFVRADGDAALVLDVAASQRDPADPFWANIAANPSVGMLFIELSSRRRYRINGSVHRNDELGLGITVREAYPNCPKYIQKRHLRAMSKDFAPGEVTTGSSIAGGVEALVRAADTVFVASADPDAGADASHRGGLPGFVEVIGPTTLRLPDYHGNSIFNTLGNLERNAQIGLCIPDFEGGRQLQLAGRARLLWDQEDLAQRSGGTGRFLEIEVERWILRHTGPRMEWEYLDASPFNPPVAEG